jgi:NitT/TauT family transport system substrate-binding protein
MSLHPASGLLRPAAAMSVLAMAAVWTLALCLLAPAGSALAQTTIRLSLDERLEGPTAFFLVPQDKGYYRAEQLDVTIDEGAAALDPITRVASGNYEMGFADINALIKYRDQNPSAPVKAIFMVYNKPPFAIVGRKSRGITEPKSLESKKLGAPPAGSSVGEWALFAKLNDIDASKAMIENISIPVRAPMLAAGQIDAALGYSFRAYVDLKDRGVPVDDIVLMRMTDYGVKLYGSAIVVNTKFAAEKPEAVTAFLRSFIKGLKDSIKNPSGAVETVLKREDLGKKDVELERLRMAIKDNILTPEVKSRGLGDIDGMRFDEAVDQLALSYTFKNKPKLEDVFNPDFLPPAADRKIN